ncbi:MAG TPA: acetate--CoA ligase [Candidatus Acidoferrales bacterium]|nr:acetate--CoA ligase [Candidatus Acidoferrales bacterium]
MAESTPHMTDERAVAPPEAFQRNARIGSMAEYERLYRWAQDDPEGYWAEQAKLLDWFEPPKKILEWDLPHAKWFDGGKLNVTHNCVDRHLATRGDKTAILWESEDGQIQRISYRELHQRVSRFANVLRGLGVRAGDAVAVYLPMIPDLTVALLACARLGAVHSVVFGGFSSVALADRIGDCRAKALVTADGGYRRGRIVPLKATVDQALADCPTIESVIVVRRTGEPVGWKAGRDHWLHDLEAKASAECPAEPFDAEHPLYILYTSGTTGKPKGVLHSSAGYLLQCMSSMQMIFDLREDDVYWCTADIGWVTGHSYIVYGPLANGATVVMYEGAPDFPAKDRFWQIVERHRVTILYTSPTAVRSFMAWGREWVDRHELGSLRLLGSVGEPINPAAWKWYAETVGKGRCPVVDTWWQTETGSILISPLPGATPTKPGSATLPMPGIAPKVVNLQGQPARLGEIGFLVIERPWPSMLRTIYGDDERFRRDYWSRIPGVYFTGDAAQRDADGYFWILGRVDDVIKVAGHRLSTMEIESALVSHPAVAEAAVVARPDEMKGEAIVAFVTLRSGAAPSTALQDQVGEHVAATIGAIARPAEVRFAQALPKTRSGKIMRRLLRELAQKGNVTGDTTSLEDLTVIEQLARARGLDEAEG